MKSQRKWTLIAGVLGTGIVGKVSVDVEAFQRSACHLQVHPHNLLLNRNSKHSNSYYTTLSSTAFNTISIDESTVRDIGSMDEWATACGVQRAGGFQLAVTNGPQQEQDGEPMDVGVITTENLPKGSPVLLVPTDMILSGRRVREEEFGPIPVAEEVLHSTNESDQLPQWYLMVKVLTEYQRGVDSPWYPWLNSLPRFFSNGASMTHLCCSECLPPLVGMLAIRERTRFSRFFRALRDVEFLDDSIKQNRKLAKWAFAVVYTRLVEDATTGDVKVVPMADMVMFYTN